MENGFQSDCFNPLLSSCYHGRTGAFFFSGPRRHQGTFTYVSAPSYTIHIHIHYMHMCTCTCMFTHMHMHSHDLVCVCVHTLRDICTDTSISNSIVYLSPIIYLSMIKSIRNCLFSINQNKVLSKPCMLSLPSLWLLLL